ncbi:dihydrodipicolinate reductase [Caloramator quimbayensis]|uniref:4-hydroxy-tetrahydrodipicolinate reductase n=1 Tax=Caloramator quimbayensis TaxID=1147123 RepID=A0A1T4XU91_9CLOT|nr:4-hydroxy-tetrahydrodipicolinate reductase [Caloramator quimbayensis]SKA92621.1 dihydrodipicolinate reductase [Caloramator quimbayensis]
MNIVVIGPAGKMGRLIVEVISNRNDMKIVGAVAPKGRDYIGRDVGEITKIGKNLGAVVVDDIEKIIDKCDVIIDYTFPEVSINVIKSAVKHKKAVVCGTTGFSQEEINIIKEYSNEIPIVLAANTSRVVNLMYKLLEITAKTIGNISDIEIIEMHDRNKKDAPSGTSKEMGSVIAKELGKKLEDIAVYGRRGKGERIPKSIGYHSIRSGDISSSHTVIFGLLGERLEITHHAHNWECFAQGACDCAAFLQNKKAGLYTVKDVLGIEE